jgi:hypothetical protein
MGLLILPQSAGELENDEHTAGVIMQMVRTACRFRLQGAAEPPFKRISGKSLDPGAHLNVHVGSIGLIREAST